MPPQSPLATTRNSRTVVCSWQPPPFEDQNGFIIQYRINVTEVITGREFVLVSTTTSLVVGSLHPDYIYQWVVTAVTVGVGPYTAISSTRTLEDSEWIHDKNAAIILKIAYLQFLQPLHLMPAPDHWVQTASTLTGSLPLLQIAMESLQAMSSISLLWTQWSLGNSTPLQAAS